MGAVPMGQQHGRNGDAAGVAGSSVQYCEHFDQGYFGYSSTNLCRVVRRRIRAPATCALTAALTRTFAWQTTVRKASSGQPARLLTARRCLAARLGTGIGGLADGRGRRRNAGSKLHS